MLRSVAPFEKPGKAELGRIAEHYPHRMNALVAFFVMGWRRVIMAEPVPHGVDQAGKVNAVPNYVRLLGMDECLHLVLQAPDIRNKSEGRVDGVDHDNDLLGLWASGVASQDPDG